MRADCLINEFATGRVGWEVPEDTEAHRHPLTSHGDFLIRQTRVAAPHGQNSLFAEEKDGEGSGKEGLRGTSLRWFD